MSSSSVEEISTEEVMQEIREQQIVKRFDFLTRQNGPQRGAVIPHFLSFRVVRLVGIDPYEAKVGDTAVEVAHSGFYTRVEVWLKVVDGARGWASTSQSQTQFYYTFYLA
jgi:hypothetical protein